MNVCAASASEFGWIVERTGCALTAGARGIKAVDRSGRTRGMVVYDGWTESAAQAHMAVDSPVVWRSLIRPAFSYPFEECGRRVLLGIIPEHNAASLRMTEHLGFRLAHRITDGWAQGDDLLIFEMRREECRWLKTASLDPSARRGWPCHSPLDSPVRAPSVVVSEGLEADRTKPRRASGIDIPFQDARASSDARTG